MQISVHFFRHNQLEGKLYKFRRNLLLFSSRRPYFALQEFRPPYPYSRFPFTFRSQEQNLKNSLPFFSEDIPQLQWGLNIPLFYGEKKQCILYIFLHHTGAFCCVREWKYAVQGCSTQVHHKYCEAALKQDRASSPGSVLSTFEKEIQFLIIIF